MAKYVTIKIPKEELRFTLFEHEWDKEIVLRNDMIETGRWDILYDFVFKYKDGNIYQTSYRVGATEMQDHGPWEHDDDLIDCYLVEKFEKTVIDYKKVEAPAEQA